MVLLCFQHFQLILPFLNVLWYFLCVLYLYFPGIMWCLDQRVHRTLEVYTMGNLFFLVSFHLSLQASTWLHRTEGQIKSYCLSNIVARGFVIKSLLRFLFALVQWKLYFNSNFNLPAMCSLNNLIITFISGLRPTHVSVCQLVITIQTPGTLLGVCPQSWLAFWASWFV